MGLGVALPQEALGFAPSHRFWWFPGTHSAVYLPHVELSRAGLRGVADLLPVQDGGGPISPPRTGGVRVLVAGITLGSLALISGECPLLGPPGAPHSHVLHIWSVLLPGRLVAPPAAAAAAAAAALKGRLIIVILHRFQGLDGERAPGDLSFYLVLCWKVILGLL